MTEQQKDIVDGTRARRGPAIISASPRCGNRGCRPGACKWWACGAARLDVAQVIEMDARPQHLGRQPGEARAQRIAGADIAVPIIEDDPVPHVLGHGLERGRRASKPRLRLALRRQHRSTM